MMSPQHSPSMMKRREGSGGSSVRKGRRRMEPVKRVNGRIAIRCSHVAECIPSTVHRSPIAYHVDAIGRRTALASEGGRRLRFEDVARRADAASLGIS
jgi:hypothetical protein